MNKNVTKLVLTALFAALTCVATMVIHIRIPATGGYINVGDTIVLLSAWIIGGVYGGLAAGIGSGLADLLLGAPVYAPATFVIKFLMALMAYLLFKMIRDVDINKVVGYIISGIVAELIMVAGYFVYEAVLYGIGASMAGIMANVIQGSACLVLAYLLTLVLEGTKAISIVKKYI